MKLEDIISARPSAEPLSPYQLFLDTVTSADGSEWDLVMSYYAWNRDGNGDGELIAHMTEEEIFMFLCFILLAEDRWPF